MDERARIVNVHFTAPPFGPYGYSVPPELSPVVREGSVVSVRIGNRRAVGVVGEEAEPEDIEYREIDAVPGAVPYVPAATMATARFAATYYASSLGEALRLALPVPPKKTRSDYYYLTESYTKTPGFYALNQVERELAESIGRSGWLRLKAPQEPDTLIAFARLVDTGVLTVDVAAAKPESDDCVIRLLPDAERANMKGVHQKNIVDALLLSGGSAPLGALTGVGAPSSAVARACAKGLIGACLRGKGSPTEIDAGLAPLLIAGGTPEERLERAIEGLGALIEAGGQALIVVPEVYRAAAVAKFVWRETGADAVEYHSSVSPGRRFTTFKRVRRGTVRVVVGTRSSLFLPFANLGLTAVLDEQDPSHKQHEMAPFYASRETATVVTQAAGPKLVFTSAAPSAEAYRAAKEGRWRLVELGKATSLNRPGFVDMDRELKTVGPSAIISAALQMSVRASLDDGKSAVLIIDRRGYVPYVYCDTCGYVFRCHRCDVATVYHLDEKAMRCHHCGSAEPFPPYCPECHKKTLVGIGLGTEKVAEEVARLFPGAEVARADSDALPTARRAAEFWKRFEAGGFDVVVGTRMLLRAASADRVGVVGVVSADTALTLPDFRASERTFQLLVRLEEEVRPGTPLVVQTFYGSHHCFTTAVDGDYDAFWRAEMPLREKLGLPPFRRLMLVRVEGKDEDRVVEAAGETDGEVRAFLGDSADVVGPVPAPIKRIKDRYRMQVLAKTDAPSIYKHGPALAALNRPGGKRATAVRVDVDPVGFL
ncbi:MAG: primosomal protein N' [Candidatus Coatesbacteria bacterium]|nr:MAG: primosomal protein N' [Candidatus Coatesbacteria bacterium]